MRRGSDTKAGEDPRRCVSEGFRSNDQPIAERRARNHKAGGPYWSAESLAQEKENRWRRRRSHYSCESARVYDRVSRVPQSHREYWRQRCNGGAGTCDDRLATSTRHRLGTGPDWFSSARRDCPSHSRGLVPTGQTTRAIVRDGPSLPHFARAALQELRARLCRRHRKRSLQPAWATVAASTLCVWHSRKRDYF